MEFNLAKLFRQVIMTAFKRYGDTEDYRQIAVRLDIHPKTLLTLVKRYRITIPKQKRIKQ